MQKPNELDDKTFEQIIEAEKATYQVSDEAYKIILLVKGENNGEKLWAYVHMFPSKAKEYLALDGTKQVELEDFGEIIFSGTGENPPEEIIQKMKDTYKIDQDFESKIEQAVEENLQKLSE
ncbi:MAG: hypothetical protein SFT90_05110 [Rickettsiales bacterium]|nr:hypothetical protein [Rickettsiales bacterium]